jgi:hypothetical protein
LIAKEKPVTTREKLIDIIQSLNESELREVDRLIRRFGDAKSPASGDQGALSKLKEIKIQAPADFASRIDSYLEGGADIEHE